MNPLLLALAIVVVLEIGAAIVLLGVLVSETRRTRTLQTNRDAMMLDALERALRLPAGTIASDLAALMAPAAPPHKPRGPVRDVEAERRAEMDYYVSHGITPPQYAPPSVKRSEFAPPMPTVEIR